VRLLSTYTAESLNHKC